MQENKLTIGLFGFGCVGYGLYEVLQKTPTLQASIKKICVKDKAKERPVSDTYFTFEKQDVLEDPEINVIVELIDDAAAAFEIVSTALRKGKAVVSANKKMIAEHLEELLELQRRYNVPFLYEAACCASIPIIRNLEEYYDNDLLESIRGIVNGSTNYILTRTVEDELSYSQALRLAQDKGYAESNPVLDTEGLDARNKLVILLTHAFGLVTEPGKIFHYGIDRLGTAELLYAREKGMKIKLLAQAYKSADDKITAFVLPAFVKKEDKLFSVDDVFNGIITKTSFADQQFFVGKGAGAYPTASAVLSDLSALRYRYRYEYKKLNEISQLSRDADVYLEVYIRHHPAASEEIKEYFTEVKETYSSRHNNYTIGTIALDRLRSARDSGLIDSLVLVNTAERPKKEEGIIIQELAEVAI